MPVELTFEHKQRSFPAGPSLFDCAEALDIRVPTSCRKQGKCKECLVEVLEGMDCLSERTPEEEHLQGNFRLSCRCRLVAESGRVHCQTLRRGKMRIFSRSLHLDSTRKDVAIDPAVTREGARVLLDGEEIDRGTGPLLGLALDLGTTTVVLQLLNLETGEIIADSSFENPQRFGGSDVMSRIHYDTENGGRMLQRALLAYLNHAIEDLPADPTAIYEVVVAGNSTMRDILFGLNVHSIGQNPYRSITEIEMQEGRRTTTSLTASARQLRLPIHPKARIYGMPIISGHVGADAAACLLAVNIAEEERLIAVMDIGTNTELILGNKHKIYAASCPAGPAFEGGKIACGMPGLPGAIEGVVMSIDHAHGEAGSEPGRASWFNDPNGTFRLKVIDDEIPQGICGSGLVDLLSELLKHGKMNALGRLEESGERIVLYQDDREAIYFTEGDINELAQAKGANVAGLRILFEEYGAAFEDLDAFYLAGGFGSYLNLESSKRIGLIPNLPPSKIIRAGNASIEGVRIALLSLSQRTRLETLLKSIQHCRLETNANFFDFFVEGCQFQTVEPSYARTP